MLKEIENVVKKYSIDLFGIGDLHNYSDKLIDYGFPISQDYSISISIGLSLLNNIVDKLDVHAKPSTIGLYRHFCYDLINQRIDNSLLEISEILQRYGYETIPIPASRTTDKTNLYGLFSHKAAAYIAGLGWIGKSCLLISEEFGPRIRFGTLLTNAPLTPTGKPIEKNCGKCNICVDSCPAEAFTGNNFSIDEKRDNRYDASKCDDYLTYMDETKGYRVCGLCLKVCPFGRKNYGI